MIKVNALSLNPAAFFRLSSVAECCHKHLTLPRIVFIFLALLSFLCGNAFGYARSHSLATLASKTTQCTDQDASAVTGRILLQGQSHC